MRRRFGFSLMELTVTIAVMAVVTLGISQVMANMYKQYNQARLRQTLDGLRTEITAAVQGGVTVPNSWSNTMTAATNAAGFACIMNNTLCTDDLAGGGANVPLELRDASNQVFISTAATSGFTIEGEACNTFDGSQGNPCLIHYAISYAKRCTTVEGETQCNNPTIAVSADMTLTAGDFGPINLNSYDFSYEKSGANTVTPVVVAEIRGGGVAGSTGSCSAMGWKARGDGPTQFRKIEDPSGAISNITAGGLMTFQPGNYTCNVTMPAFQTGGFKVRVTKGGVQVGNEGNGNAPVGTFTTSVAQVSVTFNVPAGGANISVQMFCQENNPAGPFNLAYGMWGPGYGDTQLTVMSCMRRLM